MNTKEFLINLSTESNLSEVHEYMDGKLKIRIKKMTISEAERITKMTLEKETDFIAKQLIMLLYDESGERLFKNSDLEVVKNLPADLIGQINQDAVKFNKSDVEIERKK